MEKRRNFYTNIYVKSCLQVEFVTCLNELIEEGALTSYYLILHISQFRELRTII